MNEPKMIERETQGADSVQRPCSAATTVWIPVSDSPTKTAHYLVWVKDGGAGWADQACIEFYNATKQQWNGESGVIEDGGEITHWAKILPPND